MTVAKPLSPAVSPPDTGSGAGYCAAQLKMKGLDCVPSEAMMTPSPTVLEEQMLRQLFPEGGKDSKKDGSLHAAMLEQLEELLRSRSQAEALLKERDDERKATIELIELPIMQKVRQGKAGHKFRKWQQAIIMYQQRFGITDIETAKILRQQLKGQARGCICRTLQAEDYDKPDILKKMMKHLEDAYTNFTFCEEDDVDEQEQLNSSRKKPERKKAEKER